MPGVLSATLKLLQIDLNIPGHFKTLKMLWIQRLENELVHHQCQCIDIIATVTKFSFEVLRNHQGWKSLELSHLGFTLVPTKWISKQSSNNLLRRKCFYVKGKLLPIWISALWNVWWKFVVNVAKLCAHLESCPLMKV